MAAKHPVKTTTNASTATPLQPQLPPAEVFDILPRLHQLLARVDKHESRSNPLVSVDLYDDSDIACVYPDGVEGHAPLAPKDFQREVPEVKGRIRAALREIEKLPDVDRSIEEQEEEIREMELRIRRQREMLGNLAQIAKGLEGRVS